MLQALVHECLKLNFQNSKTKMSGESIDLMNKIAKILVIETSMRAIKLAKAENKTSVHLDHVEVVLPQIVSYNSYFYSGSNTLLF